MFDFLCQPVSGVPTVSLESLEVEWVSRDEALARMERPVLRDRMRDMLEFDGKVIYRAYEFDAFGHGPLYNITEERTL
jgi:8-oxo-dGTP diphosphatase